MAGAVQWVAPCYPSNVKCRVAESLEELEVRLTPCRLGALNRERCC